jgi:methylglyoxal synthase
LQSVPAGCRGFISSSGIVFGSTSHGVKSGSHPLADCHDAMALSLKFENLPPGSTAFSVSSHGKGTFGAALRSQTDGHLRRLRAPKNGGAMPSRAIPMSRRKRVALIAHDNCKSDLLEWATFNRHTLAKHELFATGTTGALLHDELGLEIVRFLSGPLGGDQQVGAGIVEGRIDFVIFFWDPLEPHPHDVDVKALLRIAVVHNVPIACNRATADFLLSSPLMNGEYQRLVADSERQPIPSLGLAVSARDIG